MLKVAYGYARASTDATLQKNSVAIQEAIIQRFAESHGYELKTIYVDYCSGSDDERVEFNKALNRAKLEKATLITWKVDRLSRSMSIFSRIQNSLHLLRFCELGDTEPNVMVLGVLLGVAYQERQNTSVRVKAAYRTLKAEDPNLAWGNPNMATTAQPAGIKVRKANAAAFNSRIQSICDDFRKAGYCTRASLAVKLNELGFTTRRGSQFTADNLRRVLNYGG
tara:strand:+ start:739 stop:1407 length:669 start_codon:yes stop_codon:yes gene_type:complete